jgi:hypothetical protein
MRAHQKRIGLTPRPNPAAKSDFGTDGSGFSRATDRRLGIRQFSMADRNIGAQIMRLCVEFRVSGWPFIPRIARGRGVRWRPQRWHQVGLHEGACCCDDHCPGRGDKFGHRVICGATQATGRVRCQGHGDGNRDDRGDRGLPGDRDPAAAGSPDRLRHRQGVFTRHGRLQL